MKSVNEIQPALLSENTDVEVRSLDTVNINESQLVHPGWYNLKYLFTGVFFGIILIKSEVVSWYRIQEMFRLQSFHMFGVIGSAVVVGILSVWLIRRFNIRTIHGEPIHFVKRKTNKGNIYGGLMFGCGWALTGACPGPLYALVGNGYTVVLVSLVSAIAGTWVYGLTRKHVPH
jgi:uncharacterized membrane protein YedE/YeeE